MARRRLRSGFTTGTAAAAAAKAAVLASLGAPPQSVEIILPGGGHLKVPVQEALRLPSGASRALVIKDAGDDPDVTNKAGISAEVELRPVVSGQGSLRLRGGQGVGRVTKPGLAVEPGNPAINPTPQEMITRAVRQALAWVAPQEEYAVTVTISVARGEELSQRTLNPRLGVLGGISILGTTGLVKPYSHEAYTETIDLGLSVAKAEGADEVVFTTGGKSEKRAMALRPDLPETAFVQIADFFAYALRAGAAAGMAAVGLASFFGKAVKQAAGHDYTHAHKAAMDLPRLAGWLEEAGLPSEAGQEIAGANTARQALDILRGCGRLDLVAQVGRRMLASARGFAGAGPALWVVVLDFDGAVLFSGSQPGEAK